MLALTLLYIWTKTAHIPSGCAFARQLNATISRCCDSDCNRLSKVDSRFVKQVLVFQIVDHHCFAHSLTHSLTHSLDDILTSISSSASQSPNSATNLGTSSLSTINLHSTSY